MNKLKKRILILFLSAVIAPLTAIFADNSSIPTVQNTSASAHDAGIEIPFNVYVAQEVAASEKNYGHTLCNNPDYYCRRVTHEDTWSSLFPNFQQREEVMRLNRTNVALEYLSYIVIPKSFKKTTYMDMSPLPAHINTHNQKLIYVDLSLFAFGAYDAQGNLVYWGPESSGADKCPLDNKSCSTAIGQFRVFRIEGKDCTSNEFPLETHGGAPMPYCLFFHKGSALHGSTLSGFINRSAGCVRLFYADASWVYEQFGFKGMEVIVSNDLPNPTNAPKVPLSGAGK